MAGCSWYPGDSIPSETALARTYGITRGTVRHAISLLVAEGLVKQVRGKGTIVTYTPIAYSIWNFSGFTEFADQMGRKAVTNVIERQILERPSGSFLRMVRARGFLHLDRIQYINIDESLVSLELFPGLDRIDFETESLYRVFREEYRVPPVRTELSLAVTPVTDVARTYFESVDVPGLLCASGRVFDAGDRMIEETSVLYSPSVSLNVVAMIHGGPAPTSADE